MNLLSKRNGLTRCFNYLWHNRKFAKATIEKKALIVISDGFEEIEAVTTADLLRRANMDVCIAAPTITCYVDYCIGAHGIKVKTDHDLHSALNINQYDVIVIPGGDCNAMKNLMDCKELGNALKQQVSCHRYVGGISLAPLVLLHFCICPGKCITGHPSAKCEFKKLYKYSDSLDVVCDEMLITSKGPGTAHTFAFVLIEQLIDTDTKDCVAKNSLFVQEPKC